MVIIQNNTSETIFNNAKLKDSAQIVLKFLNRGSAELLIRIVATQEMQQLNNKYRKQDKPTNVLSFGVDLPPEITENILGDVVICIEVIKSEAHTQNKTLNDHLSHIVVHGILHLLGYDHIQEKQALEMEALEVKILKTMDIANPYN